MATDIDPVEGHWYQHLDKGQLFRIVAFSEQDKLIEIQHFDGDLEEIELDDWYELTLELAEEPEDWTGPIDDVEKDDLGYTETEMAPEDWREAYAETGRRAEKSESDSPPEEEGDEWAEGRLEEDLYDEEP